MPERGNSARRHAQFRGPKAVRSIGARKAEHVRQRLSKISQALLRRNDRKERPIRIFYGRTLPDETGYTTLQNHSHSHMVSAQGMQPV